MVRIEEEEINAVMGGQSLDVSVLLNEQSFISKETWIQTRAIKERGKVVVMSTGGI